MECTVKTKITPAPEVHRDHRAGIIPPSDPGSRAYAILAKREALAEYRRALQIYQDFISPRAKAGAA